MLVYYAVMKAHNDKGRGIANILRSLWLLLKRSQSSSEGKHVMTVVEKKTRHCPSAPPVFNHQLRSFSQHQCAAEWVPRGTSFFLYNRKDSIREYGMDG